MSGVRCVDCGAMNVWARARYLDANGESTTYPAAVTTVESRICLSCNKPQPLGPANDGGEHAETVKVEKDALINWAPLAPFGIDYDECCCAGCQKRWLADCIAEVA